MVRTPAVLLVVAAIALSGCASSAPPPRPVGGQADDLRRLIIVGSGDSKFTMVHDNSAEATKTFDGIMSQVLKWIPGGYDAVLAPIAKIVHSAITSRADEKRTAAAASHVGEVSPRSVVAEAFAQRLEASGRFREIRTVEREPVGDERRRVDAIVRVTVPSWGLVRVRDGKPDLLAGFADVQAQMVVRATGTVIWEHAEDVTHAERLTLQAFTRDGDFARHELVEVLERAGQRLASEFLYARGYGR